MGTIFRHELRMYTSSVVSWALGIWALLFTYGVLFPSFAQDTALLDQTLAAFPPELLAAFGLTDASLGTILGYLAFAFLFVQLCLAIQAASYGFALVSVEEREWTADFLLSKPVTRPRIMTAKLLAALSALLVTDLVVWGSALAVAYGFRAGQTVEATPLLWLLAGVPVFQAFFLSVGVMISLLVKRVRSVTPYAMGLGFGMYVLAAFGDLLGTSVLEDLTPFKHFDAGAIIEQAGWDLPHVAVSVAVSLLALAASYWLYTRRDIPAVV